MRCPDCGAEVGGRWQQCPLCRVPLERSGGARDGSIEVFPAPPLRFNRKHLRTAVIVISLAMIVSSFAAQLLVPDLMAPVRTVWLSVAVLWLVALAVVQRRRNPGALVGWLVVTLSLAAIVWNLFQGPELWATTWAVPAICTAANLAVGVMVWFIHMDTSELLANAVIVLSVGLVPGLFVLLGWVTVVVPSLACVGISLALLAILLLFRRRQLGTALHRRLHL